LRTGSNSKETAANNMPPKGVHSLGVDVDVDVDDPELDELDIEDDNNIELDGNDVFYNRLTDLSDVHDRPKAISSDEEVALLKKLSADMIRPVTVGGRLNNINWIRLTEQFNDEVRSRLTADPTLKSKLSFKTEELMKSGQKLIAESFEAEKQIKDSESFFKMIKMLRSDEDVEFPVPSELRAKSKKRVATQAPAASSAPSSSSSSSASSSSSTKANQNPKKFKFALKELDESRECPLCHLKCMARVQGVWEVVGQHTKVKKKGRSTYPFCVVGQCAPGRAKVDEAKKKKRNARKRLKRLFNNATAETKKR